MNLADSEIVAGILDRQGYRLNEDIREADAIFLNTCAIRENAEQKIHSRLQGIRHLKKNNPHLVVGVLGCMAERLRQDLVEEHRLVDIVCGPDEYRKLPILIDQAFRGEKGISVQLSRIETYDDIAPLRTDGISAWLSVMRGCDKFCSFCVVPFTRGRERSRGVESILREVEQLVGRGFKDVTLLGQNVNSYRDEANDFADLLSAVAAVDTSLRVRFTTSHPQDMSDKLIETISLHPNICNYIHLPVQSGSNRILDLMNRTYTVEHYIRLVEKLRRTIPGVSLSTDIIAGFPTETEEDHRLTLELLNNVRFDGAFMFKYSPRERTKAYDIHEQVPEEVKSSRLDEIISIQREISYEINTSLIGTEEIILVEGPSKRSELEFMGRTDTNKTVIIPNGSFAPGTYLRVRIHNVTSATLFGEVLGSVTTQPAA